MYALAEMTILCVVDSNIKSELQRGKKVYQWINKSNSFKLGLERNASQDVLKFDGKIVCLVTETLS